MVQLLLYGLNFLALRSGPLPDFLPHPWLQPTFLIWISLYPAAALLLVGTILGWIMRWPIERGLIGALLLVILHSAVLSLTFKVLVHVDMLRRHWWSR